MPKREIDITKIRWDATDLQARDGELDPATIAHYADRINEGEADNFPPIVLFYDGEHYWPADGWYRGRAFEKAGFGTITADIRDGTREDAWEYAHTEANHSHGKPFNRADLRKKVTAYIRRHLDYADNLIAEKCHVSFALVKSLRAKLPDEVRAREHEMRTGRDGKSYPAARSPRNDTDVADETAGAPDQEQPESSVSNGDGRGAVIRNAVPVRDNTPKRTPFVDRWGDLFGALIRFVDDAARHHDVMHGGHHKRAIACLHEAGEAYRKIVEAA